MVPLVMPGIMSGVAPSSLIVSGRPISSIQFFRASSPASAIYILVAKIRKILHTLRYGGIFCIILGESSPYFITRFTPNGLNGASKLLLEGVSGASGAVSTGGL